jgi:2,3-bisphosphoglycerate-independent phosphoglycerate mutase
VFSEKDNIMAVKPVALIILDGWGIREMREGNAVRLANTPNYRAWEADFERAVLDASGEAVGLPADQMGNSEVGHLNLGAGRIVYQDLTRISLALKDVSIDKIAPLTDAFAKAKAGNGRLHLIGLVSDGGVHSHLDHLLRLIAQARNYGLKIFIHAITDGRDTPPDSSTGFLTTLQNALGPNERIVTVTGRYFAMDRDKRWERIGKAYDVMVNRVGDGGRTANSALEAVVAAKAEGISDEFVPATKITQPDDVNCAIKPGDSLLFFNFRADRMRQIVKPFVDPSFDGFAHAFLPVDVTMMTDYATDLPGRVLFPNEDLTMTLAETLSQAGKTQFHAAETEKYAHVTYFFNGGREAPFAGETRHLQPSPKVATYDLKPEMSAHELTDAVIQRVNEHNDDFILVNYANPDMVGHTGSLPAAIKAVETVDACAGRLVNAIVAKGGIAVVTADHGNCERMIDLETGKPHTYHTTQPVALFTIGAGYRNLYPHGILADVAPTVLHLLGVPQPTEMTGRSLIQVG